MTTTGHSTTGSQLPTSFFSGRQLRPSHTRCITNIQYENVNYSDANMSDQNYSHGQRHKFAIQLQNHPKDLNTFISQNTHIRQTDLLLFSFSR